MSLEFSARLDERGFDVELSVSEGETVAVLGPNGSGKSTLVGILAGLVRPDAGRASISSNALFELLPGRPPLWLPPHRRGISLLAQDALLFPHLSVLGNVAFGLRSAGLARRPAEKRAREWLTAVDAVALARHRPAELSGGQAQRIAVARALAPEPGLLLLDEPMAALDVTVAPALRRMLRTVLAGRTTVLVTHDVLDAYTLADRVLVLDHGHVVEHGPVREVLDRPRTAFTAEIAALNLITGVRTKAGLLTDGGVLLPVRAEAGGDLAIGERAAIAVRPATVTVDIVETTATVPGVIRGTVTDVEARGDFVRIRSGALSADVPPSRLAALDLAIGSPVDFRVDVGSASLYALDRRAGAVG